MSESTWPNIESGLIHEIEIDDDEFGLDKPKEECGIVAAALTIPDSDLPKNLANALSTLQHRGQEAAGIGIFRSNGHDGFIITKGPGLVSEVLGGHTLEGFPDDCRMGLGQVRYGTVGLKNKSQKSKVEAAQPSMDSQDKQLALVHNGNLINLDDVCQKYKLDLSDYPTDSAALIDIIATAKTEGVSLKEATVEVLSQITGAYSLAIQGEGITIGARDPHGYRPLMLGTFAGGGYALASESHTLQTMGAYFEREISRGEVVVFSPDSDIQSSFPFEKKPSSLCAFEFIYFSGPHGELEGRSVHMVRKRSGEILADEHPVVADIVIGVPDSGIPGSEGFSNASGIPRCSGVVKNRYISRTFIAPNQEERELGVTKKFQIIVPEVYDKRIVLVDDSIVRGTTMKSLVAALKRAGAKEVHLRITSAPYKWPCFFGMDTANPDDLIANKIPDIKDLEDYLGVDSLGHLSLDGLRKAASDSAGKLCMACMNGNYPEIVPNVKNSD